MGEHIIFISFPARFPAVLLGELQRLVAMSVSSVNSLPSRAPAGVLARSPACEDASGERVVSHFHVLVVATRRHERFICK
jgi:hypothetical protein